MAERSEGTSGRRTGWVFGAAVAAVAAAAVLAPAVGAGAVSPGGDTVTTWGSYFGNGSPNNGELTVPTAVTLPGPVAQVASSNSTQYALLTNGTVYAWGLGGEGQLGDGSTADSLTTPVLVQFPAGVVIARLATDAMPYDAALAVDTTGRAWGWGDNAGGAFCTGTITGSLVPEALPLKPVTALAGAGDHALYDVHGTVMACGANGSGDLGDGSTTPSLVPVAVADLPTGSDVRTLVASYRNSGVLFDDGDYFDWGSNAGGRLGDGSTATFSDVPVAVTLGHRVTQVAQGGSITTNGQTLVLLPGGTVMAWGFGTFGQLGDGTTANESTPVQLHVPAGVTVGLLATGAGDSYLVATTGTVYAVGANFDGQLGTGTGGQVEAPVAVETGATSISATANDVVTG